MEIKMINRRFGFFPRTFEAQGVKYKVTSVNRVWAVSKSGQLKSHCFVVTCKDGQKFGLYQELKDGTWHMIKSHDVKLEA